MSSGNVSEEDESIPQEKSSSSSTSASEEEEVVVVVEEEEEEIVEVLVEPVEVIEKTPTIRTRKAKGDEDEQVAVVVLSKVRRVENKIDSDEIKGIMHCIDVITLNSATNDGTEFGALIMTRKGCGKIYCVYLDKLSRHMVSPFYEHCIELHESETMASDDECMKHVDVNVVYEVKKWIDVSSRLTHPPLRYGSRLTRELGTILSETFLFYRTVNNNSLLMEEEEAAADDLNQSTDGRCFDFVSEKQLAQKEKSFNDVLHLLSLPPTTRTAIPIEGKPQPLVTRCDTAGVKTLIRWLKQYNREVAPNVKDTAKNITQLCKSYWNTSVDKNPSRTTDIIYALHNGLKATDPDKIHSDKVTMTHFAARLRERFPTIAHILCCNLIDMGDYFYVIRHLGSTGYTAPLENASPTMVTELSRSMHYIESLFMQALPERIVKAATQPLAATDLPHSSGAPASKPEEHKKMIQHLQGHLHDFIDIYRKKFGLEHVEYAKQIKRTILDNVVVPTIVGDIDNSARNDHQYKRHTMHSITMRRIAERFAEMLGLKIEAFENSSALKAVIATIRDMQVGTYHCECALYNEDDTMRFTAGGTHRQNIAFDWLDLCQVMTTLYATDSFSVTTRPHGKNTWHAVFDVLDMIQLDEDETTLPDLKKIVLFVMDLDFKAVQCEATNREIFERLFDDGNDVRVFDDINELLLQQQDNIDSITNTRFNLVHTTVCDIVKSCDVKLIERIVKDQANNVVVIMPDDNSYMRTMIARHFNLRKNPLFYVKHCVSIDQLERSAKPGEVNASAKKFVVIPCVHLMSPRDLSQLASWLNAPERSIKRVFMTGTIDILAPTPGQAFIDLLRLVNYKRVTDLVWQYDRPVASFHSLIDNHWRIHEFGDRDVETIKRFMQTFSRMTTTACHNCKDLWFVKDWPTLSYLTTSIVNNLYVKQGGTTTGLEYTYLPFKSLCITVYTKFNPNLVKQPPRPITIMKECAKHEVKKSLNTDMMIMYNEIPTSLENLQSERCLSGYSYGEEEVRHTSRHIFAISLDDVLRCSRNELHILFAMSNTLAIIDNPRTPYVEPVYMRPTVVAPNPTPSRHNHHHHHKKLQPLHPKETEWQVNTDHVKEKIKDYFDSLTGTPTCRYTRESHIHDIVTPPVPRRITPAQVITMDVDEEEEEEEPVIPMLVEPQQKKKTKRKDTSRGSSKNTKKSKKRVV